MSFTPDLFWTRVFGFRKAVHLSLFHSGLQLIGNYFEEARLLNIAHRYQQATDWHRQAPTGFE